MIVLTTKATGQETEARRAGAGNSLPENVRSAIRHIGMFLCGLLLSSLHTDISLSPCGVAFLAAVPTRYIFSAGLGAAAGYLLTQDSVTALRYIAALISVGVLSRLVVEFEKLRNFRLLPSCVAFLISFLTGMAMLTADGLTLRNFYLYLGEAAAAFLLAYLFSIAICAAREFRMRHELPARMLSGVCATVFLLLLSVSDISVFRISPARAAAVYLILVFSYVYRETGGAMAGVAAACAFLADGAVGLHAWAYCAAGLFAGMFSHTKRVFGTAALLSAFAVAFLFTGGEAVLAYLLLEAVIGGGLFLLTPKTVLQKLQRAACLPTRSSDDNPQRSEILFRLETATQAVNEMSRSVKRAAETLQYPCRPEEKEVLVRAKEEVCTNCGRYAFCWEKHGSDTLKAFQQAGKQLANNQTLCTGNMPPTLTGRCIRLTSLSESLNRCAVRAAERTAAQMKINEIRSVTADQMEGLCDILREFSGTLAKERTFDETAARRVRDALHNEFACTPTSVLCTYNDAGKLRLELELPAGVTLAQRPLADALETALGRRLELPEIRETETGVRAIFCERMKYSVEAAAAKITADSERLCGDSFESFYDGYGGYVVILSDGMGQGTRAALDSTMAASLTARLVKAGVGFQSALKMVNAALLLKSGDESLATLDVLHIDLYTGKATFYKAGAAKSLIRRQNRCLEIKRASLPAGILREVRFAETEGQLLEGDVVVLASDGAFDYAERAVKKALATVQKEEPCSAFAKRLADTAKKQNSSPRCDDVTVIALRIRKESAN